jgi:sugar phosphate isomerase/epimerase
MEISFVNDEFSTNIDEVIAFAKKNSLKYVELRKINDKDIVDLSLKEASELSAKLSSSGILVSAIASPFLKWSSKKQDFSIMAENVASEEEYFTKLMDLADVFGAPNIRIYSYVKEDISIEDLGKKLDVYSQMALDRGIALLLENDGLCNIDSVNKMHQLFELYNFSNIFPLLNMGVVVATGDDYKPQELQDLLNSCQYFHITDYDSELQRNVVVGEGDVDYAEILADKFNDICTIFSLEPHTGYPEDLQMTLNVFASYEE